MGVEIGGIFERSKTGEGERVRGKFFVAAIAATLVWPAAASAQQVTGLTATQEYGFTTLKWNPVPNATDYQIERQSVDAD